MKNMLFEHDFLIINLNPFLDVVSIINLRMTSKIYTFYKILNSHNYTRKIKNVTELLNFKDTQDSYKLSLNLEDNLINKSIILKIKEVIKKKSIFSIKISNRDSFCNKLIKNYYNTSSNKLKDILDLYKHNNLKYISLNISYFHIFSCERNNIILKKNFSNNFDTFHIDMKNFDVNELNFIFSNINKCNYPSLKNIILDNILLHKTDFIFYSQDVKKIISNKSNPKEINYCSDFIYNSDYDLHKSICTLNNNFIINIYHYNRHYWDNSFHNFYFNN